MTIKPAIGQRWISDSETELGLGIIIALEDRSVTLLFPAADESRVYALKNAPISRIQFIEGDVIHSAEGDELTIEQIEEKRGLLVYHGKDAAGQPASLSEARLSPVFNLARPHDRLCAGQVDNNEWFNLRIDTLRRRQALVQSPVAGLCGPRIGLIPHQFYIAHNVASRHAPRVLLADEVGLGKTIEAGMILHQQLHSGRSQRVLVVVPSSLQYQWLVEMLRRFNLRFSLFDEERCRDIEVSEADEGAWINPFQTEQRVLVSLDFLVHNPERAEQALSVAWDMLIVDEAHHLEWSPEHASPAYRLIERFAERVPGLLLLTATPEQLGEASHFARLRLLDPKRFHDLDAFLAEEDQYRAVAEAALELQGQAPLSPAVRTALTALLPAERVAAADDDIASRPTVLADLLDRHGTGRVLFRNTREVVKGFPERKVHPAPLELPALYREALAIAEEPVPAALAPETLFSEQEHWPSADPRVSWLQALIKQLKREKILLICAQRDTAMALEAHLRLREGVRVAVFHEGLSLIERDRAAAYFAEPDYGAQILVCSEIGSEGRNFQFAQHLVLFDLPRHPDMLEQRIGRLDRIGQRNTVNIHVPYFTGTAQEALFRWYHEGLNAFEKTCPTAAGVIAELGDGLRAQLAAPEQSELPALLEQTQACHARLSERLSRGRDRLLELNSFRPEQAAALLHEVQELDQSEALPAYMERAWSAFGVDEEEHADENMRVIRPGDHMLTDSFPELDIEGMTVCFDRETALSREDLHFLTWEHPMVQGVIDMIARSENGNANVALLRNKGVKAGTVLLETFFRVELQAPKALQLDRHLPRQLVRVLLDGQGRDLAASVSHDTLRAQLHPLERTTARSVAKSQAEVVVEMVQKAEHIALQTLPALVAETRERLQHYEGQELARLEALRLVNPSVREIEIDAQRQRLQAGLVAVGDARLVVDAVRIIVAG